MTQRYRCRVCLYIHEGDMPPKRCPWCSVGPDEFEEIDDKEQPIARQTEKQEGEWYCSVCSTFCHEGTYTEISEDWLCPECGSWKELLRVRK